MELSVVPVMLHVPRPSLTSGLAAAALAGAAREDTPQDARHETGDAEIAGEELAHHLQHAGAAADRAGDNRVHVAGLDSLEDGLDSRGDDGCSIVRALLDDAGRGGDRVDAR